MADSPQDRADVPEAPEEEQRRSRRALALTVAAIAVIGFFLAVATGRRDSALLFVGLPGLLAVALALSPARTVHGMTFKGVTVGLLLAAVYLHEGAVCVLLAAPLVYGVGHGVAALVQLGRTPRRRGALVLLPVLLLASLEGVVPGWRVAPEQTVTVVREVTLPTPAVTERIAAGPELTAPRSPLLRGVGMPLPHQAEGDGLGVGSRWSFAYPGSSHGPGGEILTEVTARSEGFVRFRLVRDTSITARWLRWRSADLSWRPTGEGRTEVRLTFRFVRGLDPSWYFGPVQGTFARSGAGYLLDSLVGEPPR